MGTNRTGARVLRGLAVLAVVGGGVATQQVVGGADDVKARAVLRDATGHEAGRVTFVEQHGRIWVRAEVASAAAAAGFHGFHVHANDSAANGTGCIADAAQPSSTWFVSADGHLKLPGEVHGNHAGDLPSLLVGPDGAASARFSGARADLAALDGKAVVLHAGPDNFGNVPLGTGPNQYTANSEAAVTATQNTGNSGDRLACGVIEVK